MLMSGVLVAGPAVVPGQSAEIPTTRPVEVQSAVAQEPDATAPPLRAIRVGLLSLEAPPEADRVLERLALRAREILPEVERELGLRPASRFCILLIPPGRITHPELVELDEAVTVWAAGFMFPARRIGGIRIEEASSYPYGTIEAVLAHEVTHMLLHDAVGDSLPLWFNEGVSTWEGRRWNLQDFMVYTRGLLTSNLPKLDELDAYFHASGAEASLAYAASFSFVSWNVGKYGTPLMRNVIHEARTKRFPAAWEAVTGEPFEKAESSWRTRSLIQYRWIPVIAGSGTLWLGATLLFLLAGIRKRGKVKAIQEKWAREEMAEAAAKAREEALREEAGLPGTGTQTYGEVPREYWETTDEPEKPDGA